MALPGKDQNVHRCRSMKHGGLGEPSAFGAARGKAPIGRMGRG